jgi:ligand-binding sensor domain-containing protein
VITSEAVGSLRDGVWTTHPALGEIIVGFDGFGRVWLVDEQGEDISSWDGESWTTYGSDEGWTTTGRLFQEPGYGNISENLVTDRDGLVWLATRDDVRVFDGQRWDIYSPEEVGFERTEDMLREGFDYYLTDVAIDGFGNLWVGDCAWMGPGPSGQGARWFDGQVWQGQDSPEVGAGCVEDIEVDQAGRVWLGVRGELYRHTPGEGWITYPHPEFPNSGNRRWGWLVDLELSAEGSIWVAMSPCGGASCDSGVFITFFVSDGVWTEISDKGPGDYALDEEGNGWMCMADELFSVSQGQLDQVFQEESFRCTVELDQAGRVWLALRGQPTLWLYDPPGGD